MVLDISGIQHAQEVHEWIDWWTKMNQHPRLADLGDALRDLRELNKTQLLQYVTRVTPNLQAFCSIWTNNPNHTLCGCLYTSLCEWLEVVAG